MMPGINQTWWPDRVDRDPLGEVGEPPFGARWTTSTEIAFIVSMFCFLISIELA
jgi:hypothetical protein